MQLQSLREKRRMTQEVLARKSDISLSMIQSLEAGRREGSVKTIIKLSKVLGVTTDELLHAYDNTNSNNLEEVTK